jgi:hypothetical protein
LERQCQKLFHLARMELDFIILSDEMETVVSSKEKAQFFKLGS